MSSTPKQVYVRPAARRLLEHLAAVDTRPLAMELDVVLREACRQRGINPDEIAPPDSAVETDSAI